MPQPPSGASEISTQVRSATDGSPAAAATISVISLTTPSFFSRSRIPTGVRTSDAGDAATLRALAERARAEVVANGQATGEVDLGVMLEIPSAILTAETYFGELQFASLGTRPPRGSVSNSRSGGEMAGDPIAALALVGLGVRSLSMAASSLPAVRRAIRASTLADLQGAADEALRAASAAEVRSRFAAMART
jgi:signal transduction protein with GAF and PtsI domain